MKNQKFLKRLNEAIENAKLVIDLEGEGTPKDVELDGAKKKSADAAHRLDPSTEYVQLEPELEFDDRTHEQSDQARPDLKPDIPKGEIKRR